MSRVQKAKAEGIEPPLTDPKSVVLPLDDALNKMILTKKSSYKVKMITPICFLLSENTQILIKTTKII